MHEQPTVSRRTMVVAGTAITVNLMAPQQIFSQGPDSQTSPVCKSQQGIEFNALNPNSEFYPADTHSIEPVVGDGKWISNQPPKGVTGQFESREFDVEIGMEITGTGDTSHFVGTTVTPVESPEQKVVSARIEKINCQAEIQKLTNEAARLVVGGTLSRGSRMAAKAIYRLKISKSFFGYSTENLSAETRFPTREFGQWLGNSPGIETRSSEVSKYAKSQSRGHEHPLDKIKAFQEWVFTHIKGRPMKYTSVREAIRKRVGDCEERAGTLVALCRSIGIPARLVWVPNHAWAECCLYDMEKQPRWIPVHTAAYNWFGWTGAHELVLQKGDRIELPNNGKKVRLVADWLSWKGAKPKVQFTGTIRPVADSKSGDPGPGARVKDKTGKWNLVSGHAADKYLRS